MSEILKLLADKGIRFNDVGQEAKSDCPFCQDTKKHMFVNKQKDVFFCHKCGESGNIWKLRKFYGLSIERLSQDKKTSKPIITIDTNKSLAEKLDLNEKAVSFLMAERGLTKETIKEFGLGLHKDEFISIPYFKGGQVVNLKYRNIFKKEFLRETGGESSLYNVDNVDKTKDLIIVEGEFDCIACHQYGFKNVISVANGATGFNPEWIDFFDSLSGKIYLAFDSDEKGNEGADKISKKIGAERCYRVKLPLKDINECLVSGIDKTVIQDCLNSAKEYSPESFYHISKLFGEVDDIYLKKNTKGGIHLNEWYHFNEFMGGIRDSEVTTITGETGSGKTTFTLNVLYHLAMQGQNVLIISSEVPAPKILVKLINMYCKKSLYNLDKFEYEKAVTDLSTKGIFFVKVHGKMDVNSIRECVTYANRKYDVKFALLDHLHFFVDAGSERYVQEIEKFMREIVAIAFETTVSVFLVAHPAKLDNKKGIVCMNDLKGSSSIKQDSHNILSVWRDLKAEESGSQEVLISFNKIRDESGKTGAKRYLFDAKTLLYEEINDLRN